MFKTLLLLLYFPPVSYKPFDPVSEHSMARIFITGSSDGIGAHAARALTDKGK